VTSRTGNLRESLDPDALARLLHVLGPNPERAGEEYERIRRSLIKLFGLQGEAFPEDLADETINRVALKLREGVSIAAADPARYFFGVARFVLLEERRRERHRKDLAGSLAALPPPDAVDEGVLLALQECLDKTPPLERRLLLRYYQGDGASRIENRKALADELHVPMNALRIRVHRLRERLERCVTAGPA